MTTSYEEFHDDLDRLKQKLDEVNGDDDKLMRLGNEAHGNLRQMWAWLSPQPTSGEKDLAKKALIDLTERVLREVFNFDPNEIKTATDSMLVPPAEVAVEDHDIPMDEINFDSETS